LETHKVPLGGQHVDLNLENQKYDKEHQMATRRSHPKENDESQWDVQPKGHYAKNRWVKTW